MFTIHSNVPNFISTLRFVPCLRVVEYDLNSWSASGRIIHLIPLPKKKDMLSSNKGFKCISYRVFSLYSIYLLLYDKAGPLGRKLLTKISILNSYHILGIQMNILVIFLLLNTFKLMAET